MIEVSANIENVLQSIRRAETHSSRPQDSVTLMAVSKTRTAAEAQAAARAGARNLGENYLSEAQTKISTLSQLVRSLDIVWHYIGAIQSNKTRDIARLFDWVHTVDRAKIVQRLDTARAGSAPLNVCIQVNIDDERQKAGVRPNAARALLQEIRQCENLQVRGLMAIPRQQSNPEATRPSFQALAALFEALREDAGPHWDTLSMGMSSDYEVAISEGSTIVRIGTAIFGPRNAVARTGSQS